jgi:catechol 2,3-dioxygenase-like lactoylglutathione lyase family enzyme
MSASSVVPARGLHHVGLTVSDLDRSVAFYSELFGGEKEWTIEADDPEGALTRVPGAAMTVTSLRLPYGNLELFEFEGPDGRDDQRRLNDIGVSHICIEVDDVDAVYAEALERGVECWYPPKESTEGPLAGLRFFYLVDPDGVPVEVLRPPSA